MRTYVYIDGFNFYYGAVQGTRLKWVDVVALCRDLLPEPRNTIERVHYCTALVKESSNNPGAAVRQQIYIRALQTLPEISVTYGSFLTSVKKMPLAAGTHQQEADPRLVTLVEKGPTSALVTKVEEKGSDVNLATLLVKDAFQRSFDAAVVLSTDSDLALPIQVIRAELGLPVGVFFPKGRYSVELAKAASFRRTISIGNLRRCQLPSELRDRHGVIRKPPAWD